MANVSTLPSVELGVLGPLQVRQDGAPVTIPGAKPRAILTMLGLHGGSVVSADTLIELLWGDDPPRTADKALQTHISSLRRTLGDGIVLTEGVGWTLAGTEVDVSRYKLAARTGRDAAAAGDTSQAVARFEEALVLWRGIPELPDGQRGLSEKTRWIEGHAALVEDRADALLATGRAAEVIGDLEAAVAEAPLRERRWGQLMLALYRAGRQGEALGAYQRARSLLADELGVDPGPELRRLEAPASKNCSQRRGESKMQQAALPSAALRTAWPASGTRWPRSWRTAVWSTIAGAW
jgi:DNA-binding SARP family transcriptional activator